jgi:hypothetical protein
MTARVDLGRYKSSRESAFVVRKRDGARKRTRTSTTVRPLAPEASASASSAIRAQGKTTQASLILGSEMAFVNEGARVAGWLPLNLVARSESLRKWFASNRTGGSEDRANTPGEQASTPGVCRLYCYSLNLAFGNYRWEPAISDSTFPVQRFLR